MSIRFVALALVVATATMALSGYATVAPERAVSPPRSLKSVSDFDRIRDRKARSLAIFEEVGKVIQSPRCMNCHPAGDSPTQTDSMRPHVPLVVRGRDGRGAVGLRCTACHHDENFDVARVPGNPKWALAPAVMAWQGKSLAQICAQLKDRRRNGGRDLAALQKHMAQDELVGWAWHPGADRTPAPGSQRELGDLVGAWIKSGAQCPQ